MKAIQKFTRLLMWPASTLSATLAAGCGDNSNESVLMPVGADITAPTVSATTPSLAATAATNANIKVLFSETMDGATITATTFTLAQGTTPVLATVLYDGRVATLNPIANLSANTTFTATMNTDAKDMAGNALASSKTWTFTTRIATAAGPASVDPETSGTSAIFAKSPASKTQPDQG